MTTVRELHHQAMELAENIIVKRHNGEDFKDDASRAFDLERQAAQMIVLGGERAEPSRSILYRSAAWLAVNAERYAEAVECAEEGLKGVVHSNVRRELEDVRKIAKRKVDLRHWIVQTPDVLHGAPRITGTRIPVSVVLDLIAAGKTPAEIASADYYPELAIEDVEACIRFGAGEA